MANNQQQLHRQQIQQRQQQQQPQQQQQQQTNSSGRPAFNWHVYSNRRTALLHLRNTHTLADIILETEDGSASELVHSQVISAFGDKLSDYIKKNGSYLNAASTAAAATAAASPTTRTTPASDNQQDTNVTATNQRQQVTGSTAAALKQAAVSVWQHREPAERVKAIRLPKLNRYTLHILVECAYTGSICTDLHSGGIWQILELADHYEMQDVIRACCNFLAKNLDQSNCVRFYHVGLKHKHPLMRSSWHTIRANFKHILAENLLRLHLDPSTMEPLDVDNLPRHLRGRRRCSAIDEKPYNCWLPTISFEHYQELLMHDKLNVEREESVWFAIKLWCQFATYADRPTVPGIISNLLPGPDESWSVQGPIIEAIRSTGSGAGAAAAKAAAERAARVTELLPCMRFPRFRTGTEFSTQRIWRDPLIFSNKQAQHQLAVLDRNHRDYLTSSSASSTQSSTATMSAASGGFARSPTTTTAAAATTTNQLTNYHPYYHSSRDGFSLPCAVHPRQLRPRTPHSILLAIGGWQQGQPTKLIESYDLNCNLWFESKHKILLPLAYHGIENISGILYICGGTNGNDILNEVFTFDPLTGDCHQAPSMREARCYVSTAYLDGYLYAMGGHNGLQRVKSAERFQIGSQQQQQQQQLGDGNSAAAAWTGQWTHVQDMQVARSDGSACVYRGRIYIAGGLNDQVIESSVEFYNQQDNTWTFLASMITPRTSFTLLAYPALNCLLALGGNDGSERLSSVEKFDFSTNSWSLHSNMRHRRSTFSACLLDQTKLLVVGGYNGQTPFNQVEMFDEQQEQWVMLKRMRFDRSGLKVVVVNDLANASDYTYLGNSSQILP